LDITGSIGGKILIIDFANAVANGNNYLFPNMKYVGHGLILRNHYLRALVKAERRKGDG